MNNQQKITAVAAADEGTQEPDTSVENLLNGNGNVLNHNPK